MKNFILYAILFTVIICLPAFATIINIPDDYPTIQQGIDASLDGDTVLVQPGEYAENINFNGHNIVLGSLFLTTGDISYIWQTVIDGDDAGSVVTFVNGEDYTSLLIGFTIQNGCAYYGNGGGIFCGNSSPSIRNNLIWYNIAYNISAGGGGIFCLSSDAVLSGNTISSNHANGMLAYGGGIYSENSNLTITNNVIWFNFAKTGGGIYCRESNPELYNNTITRNWSDVGAGIYCDSNSMLLMTNSIIWGNNSWPEGSEIFLDDSVRSQISFSCVQDTIWPGEGNISEDPLFRNPYVNFHLMSTACGDPYDSPCIDAGHPDILDSLLDCSWGLGQLRSDMGAYGGGDSVTVGIDHDEIPVPDEFSISQNYPNPFNAMTVIRYSLPEPADVVIEIYDILGRRVETLVQGEQPGDYHQAVWNAIDRSSGMYFYRIQAGDYTGTKKMLLLK